MGGSQWLREIFLFQPADCCMAHRSRLPDTHKPKNEIAPLPNELFTEGHSNPKKTQGLCYLKKCQNDTLNFKEQSVIPSRFNFLSSCRRHPFSFSPAKIVPNERNSCRFRAQEMKESAMMLCSLEEIGGGESGG